MSESHSVRHGIARFVVIINDTSYMMRLVRNDDQAKLYRLTKDDGQCYTVGVNNIGFTCDCYDNRIRKPQGGCKHIKALQANGII